MTQDYQQSTGSIGQQPYSGQSQQPMGGTSQQPQSMDPQGSQSMGTQMGSQMGGQMDSTQTGSAHLTAHQQVGQQFESELTPELNEALEAFDRVVEVASWCADKCIESGPQMAKCARLCLDLAEIAELNEKLIARDSINGPEVAETFLRIAHQGIPILQQQQMPHVQETLQTVSYAIDTTERLLNSISGQPMGTQQGFQEMTQQPQGSQQFQQPQGSQQFQQQPQGQMSQQYQPQGGSQQPQQPQGQQFQSQQPQSQQFRPQGEFQGSQTTY